MAHHTDVISEVSSRLHAMAGLAHQVDRHDLDPDEALDLAEELTLRARKAIRRLRAA